MSGKVVAARAPVPQVVPLPQPLPERVLFGIVAASLVGAACGWMANWLGLLPAALQGYGSVLAGVGAAAAALMGAAPHFREATGPGRLRFTRMALAVLITGLVIGEAGIALAGWEGSEVAPPLLAACSLLGCALLSDAWTGRRSGSLAPLGAAGAAAGGAAVLIVSGDQVFQPQGGVWFVLYPVALLLMAFSGYVFFRIRREEAAARPPPSQAGSAPRQPPTGTEPFPRSFPRRRPS